MECHGDLLDYFPLGILCPESLGCDLENQTFSLNDQTEVEGRLKRPIPPFQPTLGSFASQPRLPFQI